VESGPGTQVSRCFRPGPFGGTRSSALLIRVEDVILCLHGQMAYVPALAVPPLLGAKVADVGSKSN
jgi:hypothetical protein